VVAAALPRRVIGVRTEVCGSVDSDPHWWMALQNEILFFVWMQAQTLHLFVTRLPLYPGKLRNPDKLGYSKIGEKSGREQKVQEKL